MELIGALGRELWSSHTPFVLITYFAIKALIRRSPRVDNDRARIAGPLVVLHVIAAIVAGMQTGTGYESNIAEICALAFELLAFVSLGTTLVLRIVLPRVGVDLPRILIDLITGACVIVVLIIVGKRAGFSVAGLITTSAVLTAVIGFSLQDTLGSVMGGLSLQIDKSVSVGDWITLGPGQPQGRVVEIRWRYTAIETRNWETVIIPNSQIVKSQVTILGRRTGESVQHRRKLEFFVDYRTSPNDVMAAVEDALRNDSLPKMAKSPAPNVVMMGYRDSYAVYEVRYWLTDLANDDRGDSDVRTRTWYALRRAGIPLGIPAQSIFLTHETPERRDAKSREEIERRMAALGSVDLFRALPPEQREELAQSLTFKPYAAGEAITHEGDKDDGLYMLLEGEAVVRIGRGPDERQVARLVAGQFFGEMSLMTGEARTATVIAATDLVTYRVDKPAFEHVLRSLPQLSEQIAEVLVQRRAGLSQAQNERDEVRNKRMETARHDLASKIRGFFGISD
ncbi:MAG TPA: mechanosensitive ion channel family protein [Kofleriaceae bacterium]